MNGGLIILALVRLAKPWAGPDQTTTPPEITVPTRRCARSAMTSAFFRPTERRLDTWPIATVFPNSAVARIFSTLVLALAASTARAWGTQGHQVIASLAQVQLTAKAKAEIDKLLALEPGETLASISTWADEHRSPTTAAWHYINFPKNSCTYDAARDCPDGNCVVAAIDRQLAVLTSNAPDEKRLTALKYVVHLVADIHQPLHAGYAEDRGGNQYQLQAFMRGSNLHALWDVGLIKNLDMTTEALTAKLLAKPVSSGTFNAASIAEESCRIVGTSGRSGSVCLNNFPRVLSGLRAGCKRCRVVHGGGRRLRRTDRRGGQLGAHHRLHLTRPCPQLAAWPGTFRPA